MYKPTEHHELDRQPGVTMGIPDASHGAGIHQLVRTCEPLDLNSTYAYLLLSTHFAQTCVYAVHDGRAVGFISAYLLPQKPEVLFVWQVAVAAEMRGRGLAKSMLYELLGRDAVRGCRYLETTVSPSNLASRRLFESLARESDVPLGESMMFSEREFGNEAHEAETLFRIGPIEAIKKENAQR